MEYKIEDLISEHYECIDGDTLEEWEDDKTDAFVCRTLVECINESLSDDDVGYEYILDDARKKIYIKKYY